LKRDQVWFGEIIVSAADSVPQSDDTDAQEAFAATLRQRVATLQAIVAGFGRAGVAGRWENAFGNVVVTPADNGAYRIAIETRTVYGTGSDRRRECQASTLPRPDTGSWLAGRILRDAATPAKTDGADAKPTANKTPLIKIRRHGEALRVVADDREWREADLPGCADSGQITASYFASGKAETAAAGDRADTGFVAPTFDCARPSSATAEEICADPDLAENDRRLNRAWKALLPRLDEATWRALTEDQRGYVRAQTNQYPQFLHPAWEKQTSQMHYTGDAREQLYRLQLERIALLDGFDERRSGFAGVWMAHNAILKVTPVEDGGLKGEDWKWDQGDWKAGCDYEIKGKVTGGNFRSEAKRNNPDTLERDHAMLIVNRQDDVFAKQPWKTDGTSDANGDQAKCRRNLANSSTARLFPARPSRYRQPRRLDSIGEARRYAPAGRDRTHPDSYGPIN
jgi:uncharacterized protein YecT (DUF1311 family)